MQTIGQSYFDACVQSARTDFIQRMKGRLRYAFPDECQEIGGARLVELINSGVGKAAAHGIEIENGVVKFISLMLAFGSDFYADPKHLWARQILDNEELDVTACKGELLYEAALEHARIEEGIDEDEDK